MDPGRNRPSRPRLRSHGNSARVLVFDQAESDDHQPGAGKSLDGNSEATMMRRSLLAKVESKEAPVRDGN